MKETTLNPKEEFLAELQDFFQTRSVKGHLLFVDDWMELILSGKARKKWTNPTNIYFLHEKLNKLFTSCHQILKDEEHLDELVLNSKLDKNSLKNENRKLIFAPYHLQKKEQLQPFEALKTIFDKQDINNCILKLKEWLINSLKQNYAINHADYIAPLHGHIKKLIEACWLIHERVITKNSYAQPYYPEPLLKYALTEPFLFFKEEVDDPFSMVEEFFELTNLSGYRRELQEWYFMAITDELSAKKPVDVYFIHNQYSSLIQAGFIITAKNLNYTPNIRKNDESTMGQWLLSVRDHQVKNGILALSDEAPHVLTMSERADPLAYCKKILNLGKVRKLRFGLSEWLEASFSKNSSLHGLDAAYAFEQYLTLQKLTEAFYLVITENATNQPLPVTNTTHEA